MCKCLNESKKCMNHTLCMNQKNKKENQWLECNSIYCEKTRKRLEIRLDEHMPDANKDTMEVKLLDCQRHTRNTCHVIYSEKTEIIYKEQNYVNKKFEIVEIKMFKFIIMNKIEEIKSISDKRFTFLTLLVVIFICKVEINYI